MFKFSEQSNKTTVLIMLCATSFFVPYMGSSLNLALPEIAKAFNLDISHLGWLNSAFLITTAIFQIPMAKIASIIGRKKVFHAGVLFFGLSSIACSCAFNFYSLVLFRIFCGIGGAMIFGTNLAILSSIYSDKERGKKLGILTSVVYMAVAIGPFLGGISTHYLSWKSVFYIPGTFLIIQSIIIPFFIKEECKEQGGGKFDKAGAFFYGVSLFCIIFAFSELPKIESIVLLAVGVLGFVVFYYYEKKVPNPVFETSLFKNNTVFTLASLSAFFSYAATAAVAFMLSLYLQLVKNLDAKTAGLVLVSSAVVQSIIAFFSGSLADKYQPSKLASLGMLFNVLGLFGLIFITEESSIIVIISMLMFLGIGFGLFSSPNTKIVMGSTKPEFMNQASATIGTMRLSGQAFSMGIAVMFISFFENDIMQSLKFTFSFCAVICFIGFFTSLHANLKEKQIK